MSPMNLLYDALMLSDHCPIKQLKEFPDYCDSGVSLHSTGWKSVEVRFGLLSNNELDFSIESGGKDEHIDSVL